MSGNTRASLAIVIGAGILSAACANTMQPAPPRPPPPPSGMPPHHVPPPPPGAPQAPLPPPAPAETRVTYNCDNGEQVTVRYFPQQGVGVLVRGGQNVELQGVSTAAGFTYSNEQTTLRVAPDRMSMTMNVGMMATATCKAA